MHNDSYETLKTTEGTMLFSNTPGKKIAAGLIKMHDISEEGSAIFGRFLQLRDVTEANRHVIVNFDLEGRLTSIELGRSQIGNEVKILERSYDGSFYLYYKNCKNLIFEPDHVYYYYDYYHEEVVRENSWAEYLVRALEEFLDSAASKNYRTSDSMTVFELAIIDGELISTQTDSLPNELINILEKARTRYTWDGLQNEKEIFQRVYPTFLGVIPPEVRPDLNPVFAILQVTQGCWLQAKRGPCHFCGSYKDITYCEKSLSDLVEHIDDVKNYFGESWQYVRKLFLSDADPLHTKQDTETYLELLSSYIPEAIWYECFISTPTILSKSADQWQRLKSIGLKRLYWGVESANEKTLGLLGKAHNRDLLYKAAKRLDDVGLKYAIIIMSGVGALNSGRTIKELAVNDHIEETAEFIREIGCEVVYISKFIPQEDTEIFKQMELGIIKPLSATELEQEHRALVKACYGQCEVRGGYGTQFSDALG